MRFISHILLLVAVMASSAGPDGSPLAKLAPPGRSSTPFMRSGLARLCCGRVCAQSNVFVLHAQVTQVAGYCNAPDPDPNLNGHLTGRWGSSGVKVSEAGIKIADVTPAIPFSCRHGDAEGVPG